MNAKLKIIAVLGVASLTTCTLLAGPLLVIQAPSIVIGPPVVTVPAPVVIVNAGVPDDYTWDGTEYVGMVGDQYYYLGPDHVWLTLDAPRLARFHDWSRGHADWRTHAIRNDKYRRDAHGHEAPFRDARDARDAHDAPIGHPGPGSDRDHDHGHDGDDHHDH